MLTPRKEYVTPEVYGRLIADRILPMPAEGPDQVVRAFERLGGAFAQQDNSERIPRQRTSTNDQIIAHLSAAPGEMRSANAILKALRPSLPKLTVEMLATRLKNGAGKPGMWLTKSGKYGMPSAAGAASASPAANKQQTKGSMRQDAVLSWIIAHGPNCTKEAINAAFVGTKHAGSAKLIRTNDIGVDLGRLNRANKITGGKEGPYTAIVTSAT